MANENKPITELDIGTNVVVERTGYESYPGEDPIAGRVIAISENGSLVCVNHGFWFGGKQWYPNCRVSRTIYTRGKETL